MIAALFEERNSPEKSSALYAVKLQRGCNLIYYTGKQFHIDHLTYFNFNVKTQIILFVDDIV